jgi:acyl carrier protein
MSNQTIVENWLIKQLAEQLSLDPNAIAIKEPLTRYGLDSIDAVTMVGDIEDVLDVELPSTLFWDYPTIAESAQYLAENHDVSPLATNTTQLTVEDIEDTADTPIPVNQSRSWGGLFSRKK